MPGATCITKLPKLITCLTDGLFAMMRFGGSPMIVAKKSQKKKFPIEKTVPAPPKLLNITSARSIITGLASRA